MFSAAANELMNSVSSCELNDVVTVVDDLVSLVNFGAVLDKVISDGTCSSDAFSSLPVAVATTMLLSLQMFSLEESFGAFSVPAVDSVERSSGFMFLMTLVLLFLFCDVRLGDFNFVSSGAVSSSGSFIWWN